MIIGSIPRGTAFTVSKVSDNDWLYVLLDDGIQGWVKSKFNVHITAAPLSTHIQVNDPISLAQKRWMRANMVTTLTDKAPSVLLLCCPRLYGKTLYDEMEKPNQYVDEEDSEEVVVTRLNKMVAKYKFYGKGDLDPADLPVNLKYAASHIKFHKVGYRPLA